MAYFHAVVRHFVKRYLALQVFWDQLLDYWYDTVLFFNTVNNRIQVTAIRSRRSKAIDPVVVIYFVCVLLSHCLLLTSN
jgi:hypothetical protein